MPKISEDFIQHMSEQLQDREQLDNLLVSCQKPLRKSIRANRLKITPQHLRQLLESQGYRFNPIPWCEEGVWLEDSAQTNDLGNWVPHLQGQFYIQEASSMLPVVALLHELELDKPISVLDMAAAPGSKTTQLAAALGNKGLIVANELSSSRLKGLHYNIQRCGVSNTCLTHTDGRTFGVQTPQFFDAILLDAPCGGEGTVRKDEQALADWNINNVRSMATLQKELIVSAFKALKPGGRLVYSTCTLSKEENQEVCQHLLREYPESASPYSLKNLFEQAGAALTKEGYLQVYPNIFDSEGFFVACFEKSSDVLPMESLKSSSLKPFNFQPLSRKQVQQFIEYANLFAWDIADFADSLWLKEGKSRGQEIWLLPKGCEELAQKMKLNRYGIKLAEVIKQGYKLHHQAAICFGQLFSRQVIELTSEQAQDYLRGKDIYLENSSKQKHKEFLVTYQDIPLGLVKHLGSRLKNSLPRDLVRDNAFA
ncbi:16S rRNA (cytosine(1407)-C(5))-methyltransferase RsmF [Kangiella sediminilitoris]|uniref:RNA methylase, NOL1/NOP2/sun family n=1 Tax=Kangiella sediminilitoris TaxID=1144748 RepID=A0A1B3B8M9_9GAMM|nr:16S rRNA (cytosine(1407)-C(5))-methyltransferase RsmF [Kangiella sediminilitoris]AOE49159.1 RNA methylase, NOL1/NOP2/sun family [Kangiella sediminilitoris]